MMQRNCFFLSPNTRAIIEEEIPLHSALSENAEVEPLFNSTQLEKCGSSAWGQGLTFTDLFTVRGNNELQEWATVSAFVLFLGLALN